MVAVVAGGHAIELRLEPSALGAEGHGCIDELGDFLAADPLSDALKRMCASPFVPKSVKVWARLVTATIDTSAATNGYVRLNVTPRA